MKSIMYCLVASLALVPACWAKEFEIFDGQFYNGLYYPLVDIIEWGEQDGELPHLEFHLHSKDKPIDLSVVAGDKNGKPVLWIMYDLKFRNERICRHVLAPRQFKEGMKLYVYRDNSDGDYDNIFVYSEPRKGRHTASEFKMPEYQPCSDELASNKPGSAPVAAAGGGSGSPRVPASAPAPAYVPAPVGAPQKEGKDLRIDYDNSAVPFSF